MRDEGRVSSTPALTCIVPFYCT